MSEPSWKSPPSPPVACREEVHVWRVPLDAPASGVAHHAALLTADERARAERFFFDVHRRRFTVARGALRRVLGRYLDARPEALRFDYGPQGKPSLRRPAGTKLRFNVSHSGALALIAVTAERDLGVDLERVDPKRAAVSIAERFFAPEEVAVFRSLPPEHREEAFFNCWTRKEAYMKATGRGLTLGLDRFVVTLRPGAEAALLSTAWHPPDAARWTMRALDPGPGYAAALAVEGDGWRLRRFAWEG
jgi:4'-phosphopantetheinyl transferase